MGYQDVEKPPQPGRASLRLVTAAHCCAPLSRTESESFPAEANKSKRKFADGEDKCPMQTEAAQALLFASRHRLDLFIGKPMRNRSKICATVFMGIDGFIVVSH
jgi:hypothetical protein